MKYTLALLAVVCFPCLVAAADQPGDWKPLLDAKFSQFDVYLSYRADPKAPGAVAPKWNPTAPWMAFAGSNNNALAGSDEDRPGEWNTLELVCIQDRCVHIANGRVVMALGRRPNNR